MTVVPHRSPQQLQPLRRHRLSAPTLLPLAALLVIAAAVAIAISTPALGRANAQPHLRHAAAGPFEQWGSDANKWLRGLDSVAAAGFAALLGGFLAVVIGLRLPLICRLARRISRSRIGTRNLYSPAWTTPFSWLARGVVRLFVWLAGCDVVVGEFTAAGEKERAAAVAASLRSAMGAGGGPVVPGGATLVTTPSESTDVLSDLATALKDVPRLRFVAPLLRLGRALLPRDTFTVTGQLLPAGQRGYGLAVALVRRSDVLATETLWAKTYEPRVADRSSRTEPINGADALHLLGVAGSAWVAYTVLEQRGISDRQVKLGASNWRSYAFFRAGVERQRMGQRDTAITLYVRAIAEDRENDAALTNLAILGSERSSPEENVARLEAVVAATRAVDAPAGVWSHMRSKRWRDKKAKEAQSTKRLLRSTLWYQAAYSLAVAQLDLNPPAARAAYECALDLGFELQEALAQLNGRKQPANEVAALTAFFADLEDRALAVLADAAHLYAQRETAPRKRVSNSFTWSDRCLGRIVHAVCNLSPFCNSPPPISSKDSISEQIAKARTALTGPCSREAANALTNELAHRLAARGARMSYRGHYNLACYYARVENYPQSLTELQLALEEEGGEIVARAKTDPSLRPLQENCPTEFAKVVGPAPDALSVIGAA